MDDFPLHPLPQISAIIIINCVHVLTPSIVYMWYSVCRGFFSQSSPDGAWPQLIMLRILIFRWHIETVALALRWTHFNFCTLWKYTSHSVKVQKAPVYILHSYKYMLCRLYNSTMWAHSMISLISQVWKAGCDMCLTLYIVGKDSRCCSKLLWHCTKNASVL